MDSCGDSNSFIKSAVLMKASQGNLIGAGSMLVLLARATASNTVVHGLRLTAAPGALLQLLFLFAMMCCFFTLADFDFLFVACHIRCMPCFFYFG